MALSDLKTPKQVAAILHKHPKSVLAMYHRGELPGIKLGTRSIRFHERDIESYIQAHRVEIPAQAYDAIADVLIAEADE